MLFVWYLFLLQPLYFVLLYYLAVAWLMCSFVLMWGTVSLFFTMWLSGVVTLCSCGCGGFVCVCLLSVVLFVCLMFGSDDVVVLFHGYVG